MYSVFLVEDEILIREGIREMIDWEEFGFTFTGEAPDGELAWPAIQKQKPDIIITDIRMPFMDGLELSRLVKKELPATTIIILSGHDDFAYAQEAIRIGVSQYLLKPLSKSDLLEVLLEIKKKKDEEQEQRRYDMQFANEVQEYLSSSRRGLFDELVSKEQSVPRLLQRAQRLGLDLVAEQYNIVLFLLEEDILRDSYSSSIAEVQAAISAGFLEDDAFVMFSAGMDVTAFLVKAPAEEIEDKTRLCIDRLNQICEPFEGNIRWMVVAGSPVSRLSSVPECYRVTRKTLFYRETAAIESGTLAEASAFVDFNPNEMDADRADSRFIDKFLSSGLPEDVEAFVEDYFAGFGPAGIQSVLFRHYVVLNIQFAVNAFVNKLEISPVKREARAGTQPELERALGSLEGSKEYAVRLLRDAFQLRDNAVSNRYQKMLRTVIDYMEENFSNPEISLNTVAQIANVTPTHFSAIFSQQMGKTFVEYLTELRMEKARELLRCTSDSSSEIALGVGYNDPHYFSFLFKKVNGCSPRDYRSKRRG